jgi:hypothetical protein
MITYITRHQQPAADGQQSLLADSFMAPEKFALIFLVVNVVVAVSSGFVDVILHFHA